MFEMMNALVKNDIIAILKVNIPSWLTVGWVKTQNAFDINSAIQETGTSLIVLFTLLYTVMKTIQMFRHMKWAKQDRENELDNS
jgi:hypothetical protein